MKMALKILIIDDHPILADGMKNLIESSGVGQVVGIAHTAREGLKCVACEQPDLILLDIGLPDESGIDTCGTIKSKWPNIKVLALTSFGEYTVVRKMLEKGASGYLLKNAMPEEILLAIESVMQGEIFLSHEIDLLMKKQRQQHVFLTPRESDLLRLIVDGYTNSEIAEKLFLSVETVNSYRKNLLFKLDARNTAILVKMAIEQKLI
jgi:DNA-binding NarL/FixJ family response regulator